MSKNIRWVYFTSAFLERDFKNDSSLKLVVLFYFVFCFVYKRQKKIYSFLLSSDSKLAAEIS